MNTAICITLIIALMLTAISLIHEVFNTIRNERATKMLQKIVGDANTTEFAAKNDKGLWTTFKVGEEQEDEVHH